MRVGNFSLRTNRVRRLISAAVLVAAVAAPAVTFAGVSGAVPSASPTAAAASTVAKEVGVFQAVGSKLNAVYNYYKVAQVVAGFFGANLGSGPSTAEVLGAVNQLQTSVEGIAQAVTQLQASVDEVAVLVKQVSSQNIRLSLESLFSTRQVQLNAILTRMHASLAHLLAAGAIQSQIACGDYSLAKNPASGSYILKSCADPTTVDTVCPDGSLLPEPVETLAQWRQFVTAEPTDTALAKACDSWTSQMYGPDGFYAHATGNSALQGAGDAVNWSDLTQMAGLVDGIRSSVAAPGLVTLVSQALVVQSRFIDHSASQVVRDTFSYYLGQYIELLWVVMEAKIVSGVDEATFDTSLATVPSVSDFSAVEPAPVPEGTVVDSSTGLMWEQQIGADLRCVNPADSACPKGASYATTPETLTPTSITPAPGSGLETLTATTGTPSLNVASGAATPRPTPDAPAFSDWYAAGLTQLQGLFAGLSPPDGTGLGVFLTRPVASGGAGLDLDLFSSGRHHFSLGIASHYYETPNDRDAFWTTCGYFAIGCGHQATIAVVGPTDCSLSAEHCTVPASVDQNGSPALFDLTDGATLGWYADNTINWSADRQLCQDLSSTYGVCKPGRTDTIDAAVPQLSKAGFVTWFYRTPPKGGACYFYLPSTVAPPNNGSTCTYAGLPPP